MYLNLLCRSGARFSVRHTAIFKLLIMMKLILIILTVTFLHVSAHTYGQRINLQKQNATLSEILDQIREQSGYDFFYSNQLLKSAKPVSLDLREASLEEALAAAFAGQPLNYAIESGTVIVRDGPASRTRTPRRIRPVSTFNDIRLATAFPDVRGRVVDSLGNPLNGASVRVLTSEGRRTALQTLTDIRGAFHLQNVPDHSRLEFSFVGHVTKQLAAAPDMGVIVLPLRAGALDEVDVTMINTGYQRLRPNEMAGAVDVITKAMLMEQTGSTVLERLEGMSGSLNFNNKTLPGNTTGNPNSVLNMTIRGYSTISGTTDPLIIVNNFPYTGDIDNLDPNDIENIVILKDAAATAMWGIRAANGVIVITMSGSKFNQKTRVNFRATSRLTPKPDLNEVDVATAPEVYDFIAEYRGRALAANLSPTVAVPELDYLGWQYYRRGSITKEEFDAQLDVMKALDPRQQWSDLLYRNGNSQMYSLNISGGSENLAWTVAGNFDHGIGTLQAQSNRANVRMNTIYKLTEQLSLELGIAYTHGRNQTGAPAFNSFKDGGRYLVTRPLANADGSPYGWWIDRSPIYMDTVGEGLYGDLKFYPLEDWKHDYTRTELTNYVKNFSIKYSPFKDLDLSGNFQQIDQQSVANHITESESYFTRYYLALNSDINRTTKTIRYHIPVGEFRRIRNIHAESYNARLDVNFRRAIYKGTLLFNGAFDISEAKNFSDGAFLAGYVETPRSYIYMPSHIVYSSLHNGNVNTANVAGKANIANLIAPTEITQRNISTTASLSYVFDDRIIFNANARRDGANIIGVNVNERWKPNYSLALNWKVHKEKFFNVPFISNLSAGVSFGYLGNVDVSKSSRIVARISNYILSHTDLGSFMQVTVPPNPELRWEKTAHTNFKLDVGFLNDRFQLRTNYFTKRVSDLYMATTVDPIQSLPGSYVANAGKMDVKGYEINLLAKVIQSKLNYDITLTTANIKEKINYYPNSVSDGILLASSLMSDGETLTGGNSPMLFKNMPLFSMFALGGNQGVNDQGQYFIEYRGVEYTRNSDLYPVIRTQGQDMDGVKFYGTGTPKFTGAMHHRFNYRRFFLVVSLQAELGHYFKYPKDLLSLHQISTQYYNSWKQPGDELNTNIPMYTFNPDSSLDLYTHFSDHNIFKAGVIRLNNIQFSYSVPTDRLRMLNLSLNIQDVGKIWTANKEGYDYRYLNYMSYNGQNTYYALTLNIGL